MAQRSKVVGSFQAEDGDGGTYMIHVVEVIEATEDAEGFVTGIGQTRLMLGLREVEEVAGRLRIKDNGKLLWRL